MGEFSQCDLTVVGDVAQSLQTNKQHNVGLQSSPTVELQRNPSQV